MLSNIIVRGRVPIQAVLLGQPQFRKILARPDLDQFFRVVDRAKTEIPKTGEWFAAMSFADILRLASRYTVARLLEEAQDASPRG